MTERYLPRHAQNGGTVLPVANLMADFESDTTISYSSLIVTITLSHLVLEIFACDRQTDSPDHCYMWLVTMENS